MHFHKDSLGADLWLCILHRLVNTRICEWGSDTAVCAVWTSSTADGGRVHCFLPNNLGIFHSIQIFTKTMQECSHWFYIKGTEQWVGTMPERALRLSSLQRQCRYGQEVDGRLLVSVTFHHNPGRINHLIPCVCITFYIHFSYVSKRETPFKTLCFCVWCSSAFPTFKYLLAQSWGS